MIINKKENWYEKLFDLFSCAYNLTLTQTEISDIINEVHEVSEQSPKTGQVDAIVTLLHKEAEKLEKQGLTQGKIGNTHAMHGKMDTARCFRIAANTLSGDQAG